VAFGDELIDPRFPDGDDRKLSGHEKPVGADQRQESGQAP
jgi:hypothetical protein